MNRKSFYIGNRQIGEDFPPYIIAEMSGNHNQSLDKALEIVDAAARSGADALKIQTYKPETMTLDISEGDFFISDPQSLWKGKSLYELYGEAMTPWEWHKPIQERCRKHNMHFFSTPFDGTAVDFLEELDVPVYKVASFEIKDIPLIKKIASTKKPMIISTGMSSLTDIADAVDAARSMGCERIALLKCTSSYPATAKDANIRTMENLKTTFDVEVGLSDHTMGVGVALAAIARGAIIVEKHFTISRKEKGVDSTFSMEPHEFELLTQEGKKSWESLGSTRFGATKTEEGSLIFRRSLYIAEDIKAGEVLTKKNLRSIRPGYGLDPKYYDILIGKKIHQDVKKGTPMKWELIN